MHSLTNRMLLIAALTVSAVSQAGAQEHKQIPVTSRISVEGNVKHPMKLDAALLAQMNHITRDSIVIYNHMMEKRKSIKMISGVPLKELLQQAEPDAATPKELSEYYIICVASDGYKVVFSWNEVCNTAIGQHIIVVTGADGKTLEQMDDRIALLAPEDIATGRRYVQGLSKIIIARVK